MFVGELKDFSTMHSGRILRKYHSNIKNYKQTFLSSIGLFGRVILSQQIKQWARRRHVKCGSERGKTRHVIWSSLWCFLKISIYVFDIKSN